MTSHRKNSGFTVAELLVSVTLTAMLMAAMGVAWSGGLTSFARNEENSDLAQAGRAIMDRMTREIRSAQSLACSDGQLTITPPAGSGGPQLIRYVLDDGVFYYRTTTGGDEASSVLIGSDDGFAVQQFDISITEVTENPGTEDEITYASLATIMLNLSSENYSLLFTGSASPRGNH